MSFVSAIICQSNDYNTYPALLSSDYDFGHGTVMQVDEDWNGFVWFATTDGLYRYDGTFVKRYDDQGPNPTLNHSLVYSILIDHEEKVIWVGTRNGLTKFDPGKEKSTHYLPSSSLHSLSDGVARRIIKDKKGRIWVSCYNRGIDLYRPESDDFKNFYFDSQLAKELHKKDTRYNVTDINSYTAMCMDSENPDWIWLGTTMGLIKFDATTGEFDWIDPPFSHLREQTKDYSIVELYSQGDHVFVGQSRGLYSLNKKTLKVNRINLETAGGESLRRVTNFIKKGEILGVSFRNGLLYYNPEKEIIVDKWLDRPDKNNVFGVMHMNDEGMVFVASSGKIVMFNNQNMFSYGFNLPEELNANIVLIRTLNQQEVLVITDQDYYYIFHVPSSTWRKKKFSLNERIDNEVWRDIHVCDTLPSLLLSSENLYEFDYINGRLNKIFHHAVLNTDRLEDVHRDHQNNIWVSSLYSGLFYLNSDGDQLEIFTEVLNSESHKNEYTWLYSLSQDYDNRLWLRLARGYTYYDFESKTFSNFHYEPQPNRFFKYLNGFAFAPNGDVWVGTEDYGLGLMKANQIDSGIVEQFNTGNGLLNNRIREFKFDSSGKLWILNDEGFTILDSIDEDIFHLPWSRGIPNSMNFEFLDENNIIVSVSDGGIAIIPTDMIYQKSSIPQPYITNARLGNNSIYQGNLLETENIEIRGVRELLNFEFSSIGFENPKEFSYQLSDVDQDWVETGETRTTSYSNLDPGEYSFSVRSRLVGGTWSAAQTVSLSIIPFWWESSIFQFLLLALIAGVVYVAYQWRTHNIRQKTLLTARYEQQLQDLQTQALRSQMNPHFLFNSLNSIQHFIIKNQSKEAIGYLDRFSRLMRLILNNSRSKRVILKDELEAIRLYLDLEKLRFTDTFDYSINYDDNININTIEIPPTVIQPFIENAILHGLRNKKGKGSITLNIEEKNRFIICEIIDDGIGREASRMQNSYRNLNRKSMGLNITNNRLQNISDAEGRSGSYVIEDLYEGQYTKGTKVIVKIPI